MAAHRIKFPFVREPYSGPKDGEFVDEVQTWRPGTRVEHGDYEFSDEQWVADGEGFMVLEELGNFKPGRFPERTFYLRRFVAPDGRQFGKDKVRVIASSAFKRMLKGYRHQYLLDEQEAAAHSIPASPTQGETQ
jgi:hypothetical protein